MNRSKYALIALALCLAAGWWVFGPEPLVNPLPPIADVDSITAHISYETGDFQIPAKYWESLYDSLQPARQDDSPSKWIYIGDIYVYLKQGGFMHVFLFQVNKGAGAFSISEGKQSVYYRGGDSAKMIEVLKSAHSSQ